MAQAERGENYRTMVVLMSGLNQRAGIPADLLFRLVRKNKMCSREVFSSSPTSCSAMGGMATVGVGDGLGLRACSDWGRDTG